nr:hypothetical protein [Tanacetum cinerariifolium]
MRELREDTFLENKNDDAHEYVEKVLYIVSLFNIPRVTHDAVMLRVFPITLTGDANRWFDRIPSGIINTWDLLKKVFIHRYCPMPKTTKQLKEIHNFKKEGDETLYQAWERYRRISSGSPDGIVVIIRMHLDKEYPLNEEVKVVEEVKYGQFGWSFPNNGGSRAGYHMGPPSLAAKAILSGVDNRPPILEKDMYDSWESRMELYMLKWQHGRMILESVESGPLLWPTIEENGVTRLKKYSELSTT